RSFPCNIVLRCERHCVTTGVARDLRTGHRLTPHAFSCAPAPLRSPSSPRHHCRAALPPRSDANRAVKKLNSGNIPAAARTASKDMLEKTPDFQRPGLLRRIMGLLPPADTQATLSQWEQALRAARDHILQLSPQARRQAFRLARLADNMLVADQPGLDWQI